MKDICNYQYRTLNSTNTVNESGPPQPSPYSAHLNTMRLSALTAPEPVRTTTAVGVPEPDAPELAVALTAGAATRAVFGAG